MPIDIKSHELFLREIGLISDKYEPLKKKNRFKKNRFNIFSILRKDTDEVNLHSRFIYELIQHNASHSLHCEFLSYFLKDVCELSEMGEVRNYKVHREHQDIDLFIQGNGRAIIIENKIWADDQNRQLTRYYDKVNASEKHLVYLTLYGREPSDESTEGLPEDVKGAIKCVSYRGDIQNWIDKCVEKAATEPELRETLVQYKKLIQKLTGNTMDIEERKELTALLGKSKDYAKSALELVHNWNHVRWHTEWDYWVALEQKIKASKYDVLDIQKFSPPDNTLSRVIWKGNKNACWYGLMFPIAHEKEDSEKKLCVFIERGCCQFGLLMISNNVRSGSDDTKYDNFCSKVEKIPTIESKHRDTLWLIIEQGSDKSCPDFENIADTVYRLSNETERGKLIDTQWEQIEGFIEEITPIIKEEGTFTLIDRDLS